MFLAILPVCSCSYEGATVSVPIDPNGWNQGDVRELSYFNTDTMRFVDISVFATYKRLPSVGADSLMLTITTITPDSIVFAEDMVLYPEPGPGRDFTAWHESRYPYRLHARLTKEGRYTFGFSHNGPLPVKGIKAMGLEISLSN